MKESEAQAIAQEIFQAKLEKFGFHTVEVRSGFDHDGEPVFFLDTILKANSAPIDGAVSIDALSALRRALLDRGEERFPHILFHHMDDEYPEDERSRPDVIFPTVS